MAVRSLKNSTIENFANYSSSMNAGYSFQDFELIESAFLASSTSSITFNNLNQYATEYKHLQIRVIFRSDNIGGSNWGAGIRFNGDSGSNYVFHGLRGTGSGVVSYAATGQTGGFAVNAGDDANLLLGWGAGVIDILDAFSTSKNKTTKTLSGFVEAGNGMVDMLSNLWLSTSAINSVNIYMFNNFIAGSRFSIYGIR